MINPKVSQAVAAVLALGVAAGAQAVDITTVPSGNILYTSGATSIDPALEAYFINSHDLICNTADGAIDVYTGTTSGGKFTAVACVAGSNIGSVTAGTEIAYIKEDNGASLNGIQPVNTPTANFVSYPVVSTLTLANCPAGATTTPAGEQTQTAHTCTGYSAVTSTATTGPYANLGLSDVEAAIFGLTPTNTTVIATLVEGQGIAVSLGLYHALQATENGSTNVGDTAPLPTLARAQLAAIFNGTISSWSTVENSADTANVGAQSVNFGNSPGTCYDGTAFSTAADCTSPPSIAPSTTSVYICERGQSSGTQATAQIYFANQGCASGVLTFPAPSKPGTSCAANGCTWSNATYATAADKVFAGNGTGDALACLEGNDQEGHFAIGLASTDQAWGTYQSVTNTARADWRFIEVDGVTPSNENIAAGRYGLWAQSEGYYPNSTSAVNYPTGAVGAALLVQLTTGTTAIGSIGSVVGIDDSLERTLPAFDGGELVIPSNTVGGSPTPNPSNASLATFRGNPVSDYIKELPTNSCQVAYLAPSAPDATDFPTWAVP